MLNFSVNVSEYSCDLVSGLPEGTTYMTESGTGYSASTPSGAYGARVLSYGGSSVVWNQLFDFDSCTDSNWSGLNEWDEETQTGGSYSNTGITVKRSGKCEFTVTCTGVSSSKYQPYDIDASAGDVLLAIGLPNLTGINLRIRGNSSEYYQADTIVTLAEDKYQVSIRYSAAASCTDVKMSPMIFNLTRMYGSGNEPTSMDDQRVAFIRAYAADHGEYDSGSVVNADVSEIDFRGVNLLEKNPDNIVCKSCLYGTKYYDDWGYVVYTIPGETYYMRSTYTFAVYQSDLKTRVGTASSTGKNVVATGPFLFIENGTDKATAISRFSAAQTIIAKSTGSVSYVPFVGKRIIIPEAIRAKNGYGCSIGDSYNYISFEDMRLHKTVSKIDLGTLTWNYDETAALFYASMPSGTTLGRSLLCGRYTPGDTDTTDKTIEVKNEYSTYSIYACLVVKDSSYTDVDTFAASVSGVYLNYKHPSTYISLGSYMTNDCLVYKGLEESSTVTFVNDLGLSVPYTLSCIGRFE